MGSSIFVFEFITGGGFLAAPLSDRPADPPRGSLLKEGYAMLAAMTADLVSVGSEVNEVSILWDQRLAQTPPPGTRVVPVASPAEAIAMLRREAAADWTLVIAPEFEGHLARCAGEVVAADGRLLGPGVDWIRVAADKQAMAECLAAGGVNTPEGATAGPGDPWPRNFPLPAVLKPRWGAGSAELRLLQAPLSPLPAASFDAGQHCWRLERFCPGRAVSVALLRGEAGTLILPPMTQRLSSDGAFTYEGGDWPLAPAWRERATALARRALAALPGWTGYVGLDMVLGDADDGRQDVVIEVNPRLTTSYVGLRAAAQQNLAGTMLTLAEGRGPNHSLITHRDREDFSSVTFRASRLCFSADGQIDKMKTTVIEIPSGMGIGQHLQVYDDRSDHGIVSPPPLDSRPRLHGGQALGGNDECIEALHDSRSSEEASGVISALWVSEVQ